MSTSSTLTAWRMDICWCGTGNGKRTLAMSGSPPSFTAPRVTTWNPSFLSSGIGRSLDCTTSMLHTVSVKAKDLIRLLEGRGWELDRIRGSHHQFKHPRAMRTLTVPVHGKEIPERLAKIIIKQAARAIRKEG